MERPSPLGVQVFTKTVVCGNSRLASVCCGVLLKPAEGDDRPEVDVLGLDGQGEIMAKEQVAVTMNFRRDLAAEGLGLGIGQSKKHGCFVLAH